jgi:hypothetical protein
MCVIIDADVASILCKVPPSPDLNQIIYWVECQDGKIVYGGKLKTELYLMKDVRRRFQGWWRAGKALENNDPRMEEEERKLMESGLCSSKDHHVLALAIVTRVRLLCSHDKNLHSDFTNPAIINDPRGHVYQNHGHNHLLCHTPGCIGRG